MMKSSRLAFLFFAVMMSSCGNNKGSPGTTSEEIDSLSIQASNKKIKTHPALLWSKTDFMGGMELQDRAELVRQTYKAYSNQSIYDNLLLITAYFTASGCAEYRGNIRISHDSLFLRMESNSEMSCTEEDFYKVTYVIDNPGHKKYTILKQ
jgi:hypothetical protein